MKEISATDAARGFSALLDEVEHNHETFVVVRGGRNVAHIAPAAGATGAVVKSLLRSYRPDKRWSAELTELRQASTTQDRAWHD